MFKIAHILKLSVASAVVMIASTAGANAQAVRKIVIANDCSRPIQMMIYNASTYRNWIPHGWYKFAAYESYSYVRSQGVILTQLEDHDLYFYAETTDGGTVTRWQNTSSGISVEYQGGTYRTMKANTSINDDGDMAVRITCP